MKKEIKLEYGKVEYEETQEVKDAVFEAVIGFFKEHEAFNGECIMQSDDPIIYAPELLSEIADNIIEFKVEYE